jgi:hypothetical protein
MGQTFHPNESLLDANFFAPAFHKYSIPPYTMQLANPFPTAYLPEPAGFMDGYAGPIFGKYAGL